MKFRLYHSQFSTLKKVITVLFCQYFLKLSYVGQTEKIRPIQSLSITNSGSTYCVHDITTQIRLSINHVIKEPWGVQRSFHIYILLNWPWHSPCPAPGSRWGWGSCCCREARTATATGNGLLSTAAIPE